jgi:hypothetical protein
MSPLTPPSACGTLFDVLPEEYDCAELVFSLAGLVRLAGLHEPQFVRQHDQLTAVSSLQLGQDPADVGLGR